MNEVSAIEVSLLYAVRLKGTVWWHDWKSIRRRYFGGEEGGKEFAVEFYCQSSFKVSCLPSLKLPPKIWLW
jgi:hypothetical protein